MCTELESTCCELILDVEYCENYCRPSVYVKGETFIEYLSKYYFQGHLSLNLALSIGPK
jgi:hypothetical protein